MSSAFYGSAELRWFVSGDGNPSSALLYWFRRQNQLPLKEEGSYDPGAETEPFVKREKTRTDDYLRLPDCDSVGVKQRQGMLEVKALVTGPRPYSHATAGITGYLDQWIKWSFASQLRNQLEGELARSGPWTQVVKDRHVQKYSYDSKRVVAVPPDARPATGCNVELTNLSGTADGKTWVTLGFEAFGPSGQVCAILDEAVGHFFTAHGRAPIELTGRNSLSYPRWLASFS